MEGYVTADVVASVLGAGVTRRMVMSWRKTLGLPSTRFGAGKRGGTVLFQLSEVELWRMRIESKQRRPKL